ncbi:MAG: hypothetical protein WC759_02750 [Candidatus Micrarchaeia archaeon]
MKAQRQARVNELMGTSNFVAIQTAFSEHFKERLTKEELDVRLKAVAYAALDVRENINEVVLWRKVNATFRDISAEKGKRLSARQANRLINMGIEEHCDVMDRAGKIEARAAELGILTRDIIAMDRLAKAEAWMTDIAQVERLVRTGFVTSEYEAGEVKVALTNKFEKEFGKFFVPGERLMKARGQKAVKVEAKKPAVKVIEPAVAAPKIKREKRLFKPVAVAKALAFSAVVGLVIIGVTFLASVMSPAPVSKAEENVNNKKPVAAALVNAGGARGSSGSAEFKHVGIGLHNYHVDKKTGAESYRPVFSFDATNDGKEPIIIQGAFAKYEGRGEDAVIIGGPVKIQPGESERIVIRGRHVDGKMPYGKMKGATIRLHAGASEIVGEIKCIFMDHGVKAAAKSYAKGRPVSEVLSTPELMFNLVGTKCERQILALNAAGMMQQDAKLMHLVEQFKTNTGARKGKWLQGQIEEHLKNLAKEIHGA